MMHAHNGLKPNTPALLLGIDGGASKTIALLASTDGTILGRAQVGGSNKQVSGVDLALATLDQSITLVFAAAGLPIQTVAAACLGLSGVDRPADYQLIQGWAEQRQLTHALRVVNDAQLVVAAGTPGGYGVGLICGTGSIAIGRAIDGRTGRAGGWGYLLGDEGSGYDIALRGLRAAAQAADGRGTAHQLLAALLAHWQLQQPSDLIPHVYHRPDPRAILSDLPPLISDLADQGDPICVTILAKAGRELAAAVIAVADQIGFRGPIPLGVAGSVGLRTPLLLKGLLDQLALQGRPADPLTPVEDPTLGALRLARDLHAVGV
jgi:N-acetylglucosamine kinase-like BadF-type ATPase